jgi:predicted nucleic acid-binding protein
LSTHVAGAALHQPSEAIAVDAARLRARHPISLPDAYLLARAEHRNANIVSFDRTVQHAAARERLATV